jgi:hypothetical protein
MTHAAEKLQNIYSYFYLLSVYTSSHRTFDGEWQVKPVKNYLLMGVQAEQTLNKRGIRK